MIDGLTTRNHYILSQSFLAWGSGEDKEGIISCNSYKAYTVSSHLLGKHLGPELQRYSGV